MKLWKKNGWPLKTKKDGELITFDNETMPPALFAIDPPAPSWLFDNRAISRGYLDDACDGFVEVHLTMPHGKNLLCHGAHLRRAAGDGAGSAVRALAGRRSRSGGAWAVGGERMSRRKSPGRGRSILSAAPTRLFAS